MQKIKQNENSVDFAVMQAKSVVSFLAGMVSFNLWFVELMDFLG